MRHLVLMRGGQGAGKSTFIKENNLEQYTLSADSIRLLFQSPIMTSEGKSGISAMNDGRVWKLLFELLEERMKRGEFTIIDATHSKREQISRYRKLAQKYRYRVSVVDMSDIPLETLLEQNRMRPEYKFVPEHVIMNAHARMTTEKVPNWVNVIKPHEFKEEVANFFDAIDFSEWNKIHHIGDIHGSYTALIDYFEKTNHTIIDIDGQKVPLLKEDELYIFLGDYLDRGLENAEVLKFLLNIKNNKNIILLEGNHEIWMWYWANDEVDEIRSRDFINFTMPELDKARIDKKEVRQLYRKLRQIAYYTHNFKTVVVTHGGLSNLPENSFMYLATEQFIKGVGDYNIDVDYAWEQNVYDDWGEELESNPMMDYRDGKLSFVEADTNWYQIHGHRNIFRLPVQASKNSFNLEGQVESGGYLRVVVLSDEGFETFETKNTVFQIKNGHTPSIDEKDFTPDNFLEYLRNHDLIKESVLEDNISSFNFTRKAFTDKKWDDINIKARGLFINTNTKEIVSRSYNKFFNIGERSFTKVSSLADNLVFPVSVYNKANGYLGTVGYNNETDNLVFTSKSQTSGSHAEWLKDLFYKTFSDIDVMFIAYYLKEHNVSLVFEVVLPEEDPHIIEYKEPHLVLLDIVKRSVVYDKMPYSRVRMFGLAVGVETKKLVEKFDNWLDFYKWYRDTSENWMIKEEGYVIEDSEGFMTKMKLPYYNFWKQMRGVKDKIAKKHEDSIKGASLYTPLHNYVFSWMKEQDRTWLKETNIIEIRNKFLEESAK